MSYEVRLYAGRVALSPLYANGILPTQRWLHPLAVLSPPAWGRDSNLYALKAVDGDPTVFFYGPDGNTMVTVDKYGAKLWGISLDRVIAALEYDLLAIGWESHWALSCLRELRKFNAEKVPRWDIRVALYGH